MNALRLLAIAVLLAVSGCASLRVQVSVLDPEVVREMADADRLMRDLPSILTETETSVAQFFVERKDIHGTIYGAIRQAYTAEAAKYPATSNDYRQLTAAADGSVMPASLRADYEYWQIRMMAATRTLQELWPSYQAVTDPSEKLRLRNRLLSALDEREAVQHAVDQALINDFDLESLKKRLAELPPQLRAQLAKSIQRDSGQSVADQATHLFNSGDIQLSPYVFYVAKAPEEKWAAQFDQTVGRGTFGNTDIAIKALAPGNFTIKGVSFNPADVAAAAAKVTSQTVLLAAQIAGVPVKLSDAPPAGTSGGALAQSSQGLGSVLAENERVDQRLVGQREALLRIAAAIVSERYTVLHGTPTQRKSALDAIKSVYESHAPQLRISDSK